MEISNRVLLAFLPKNIVRLWRGENLFFFKEELGIEKDIQISFHPRILVESKRPFHLVRFRPDQIKTLLKEKYIHIDAFPFPLLIVHGQTLEECEVIIKRVDKLVTHTMCKKRTGAIVETIENGEVIKSRYDHDLNDFMKSTKVRE